MLQKGLYQISPSKEVINRHRRISLQNTLQLQVVTRVFIDEASCFVLIMDETEGQGVKHAAAGNTSPQGATTAQTFKSQTHCLCRPVSHAKSEQTAMQHVKKRTGSINMEYIEQMKLMPRLSTFFLTVI